MLLVEFLDSNVLFLVFSTFTVLFINLFASAIFFLTLSIDRLFVLILMEFIVEVLSVLLVLDLATEN